MTIQNFKCPFFSLDVNIIEKQLYSSLLERACAANSSVSVHFTFLPLNNHEFESEE